MEDNAVLPGQASIFDLVADEPPEQAEPVQPVEAEEICEFTEEESSNSDLEELTVIDGQLSFVDPDGWWKEHWVGMPEFVQEDAKPWKSMYIHFRSLDDLKEFSSIVAQRMTADTPSIWYPEMPREKRMHMGYVDES